MPVHHALRGATSSPPPRPSASAVDAGSIRLKLYVREGCPFSPVARERTAQLSAEDPRIRVTVCEAHSAGAAGQVVTPLLVLPNRKRLAGTPSLERLRCVVSHFYGTPEHMSNKVWYLERNRLFRGVPAEEIQKFAHLFREADYPGGQIIFNEGDLGDAIYLLKSGHVRLYRVTEEGREATLAVLGPGDVFGELALFDEMVRTTVAEVMDDAHICAASVEQFNSLMSHKPQLTIMVAREIARRRQETETRVAGAAFATVRGRVVNVLRHLAEEHGERLPMGETRILVRFSHQQIASFAGASRESCTVELGRLQHAGLLKVDERHHFVIPNLERLKPNIVDALIGFTLRGAR